MQNVTDGARVLYSLYGIVEHSGSMRGGHYAAYVKVRTPSKKLLEHLSTTKNVLGMYKQSLLSLSKPKSNHWLQLLILKRIFSK